MNAFILKNGIDFYVKRTATPTTKICSTTHIIMTEKKNSHQMLMCASHLRRTLINLYIIYDQVRKAKILDGCIKDHIQNER